MRTEQDSRDRVARLLAEAGLTEEAAVMSNAWQEASERMQRIRALGTPTLEDSEAYQVAFDNYFNLYDRAGVWSS